MITSIIAIIIWSASLVPGWNLVGGTGQTPAQYAADNPCVAAIYTWDSPSQSWRHWFADVPDYVNEVNGIKRLRPEDGMWVKCNAR